MLNAMTVDVEDYFQVSAFEPYVDRSQWESRECRIERNVDRILELFEEYSVRSTFFTLGWVAERYPELVRRIVGQGHELASHGWEHVRVINQTPAQFRADVVKTKSLLEDVGGVAIRGYRAASYSITRTNLWALDVLGETGHAYSSSIMPIRHDLYGIPDAPRFPFRPSEGNLLEIPVTTVRLRDRNYPCAGGGWFRLLPYGVSKWALRRVNAADRQPVLFYFHPWEIDPEQPRLPGLAPKTRFRHYLNLDRTSPRLRRLLTDFKWGRMDQVFLQNAADAPRHRLI